MSYLEEMRPDHYPALYEILREHQDHNGSHGIRTRGAEWLIRNPLSRAWNRFDRLEHERGQELDGADSISPIRCWGCVKWLIISVL